MASKKDMPVRYIKDAVDYTIMQAALRNNRWNLMSSASSMHINSIEDSEIRRRLMHASNKINSTSEKFNPIKFSIKDFIM